MNPKSMEKAMLKNMVEKTGKPLEEWIRIVNEQNFILNNFADNAASPNRVMLKFNDSLPSSLSSYNSYTESEVQTMQSDSSSDWYLG